MLMKNLLLIDNFDSFTYNLVDYLSQLGANCHVVRNDVSLDAITGQPYDGVVLSPGPETPEKAGNLMEILAYYHQKLPILGVCLGHQAIGEFFGAKLGKAIRPMHGKLSTISVHPDPLWNDLPSHFQVVRYHSLILTEIAFPLKILATTAENEVMAIRHVSYPIWGVQFHPEAILTAHGLAILRNWLNVRQSET